MALLPITFLRRFFRLNRRTSGTNSGTNVSSDDYSDHSHLDVIDNQSSSSSSTTNTRTRSSPTPVDISINDSPQYPKTADRKDIEIIRSIKKREQTSKSKAEHYIPMIKCEICVQLKPYTDFILIMGGCTHYYCTDCIVQYVSSKLQNNITQIRCPVPSCPGLLEHDQCRLLLPKEVFDQWGNALCEAALFNDLTYYCPYEDCSAPLLIDGDEETMMAKIDCPNCKRLFCFKCKVPWHKGITCDEFQKKEREKNDVLLEKMAKKKKWIRCPKCSFYIDKTQGCLYMRCRCGHTFCYSCGDPLENHFCTKCKA